MLTGSGGWGRPTVNLPRTTVAVRSTDDRNCGPHAVTEDSTGNKGKKPKKRGPKEEVLRVAEDALDRVLKSNPTRPSTRLT